MIKNGYAFGMDDPNFSTALEKTLKDISDVIDQWVIKRDAEKEQEQEQKQKERKGKKRICLILEICLMECLSQ